LRKEIFTFEITGRTGIGASPASSSLLCWAFREEPFLVEDLRHTAMKYWLLREKERKGLRGSVLDLLIKEGVVADLSCLRAPKLMLKALSGLLRRTEEPLQVSWENGWAAVWGLVGCTCKRKKMIAV
jgi:hypothetical protein